MTHRLRTIVVVLAVLIAGSTARAASVAFTPAELFRIPFGKERHEIGARMEEDQFHVPRSFTMDGLGRFYIYDSFKNRIARFSPAGVYELGIRYPETARQVFAHADERGNLWLLLTDPKRGLYYGVHDPRGKGLRTATFPQYDRYRFHVGDDGELRAILSSDKNPGVEQAYWFDPATLLMKKDKAALPPPKHHRLRRSDRTFFIDPEPGTAGDPAGEVHRVTNEARRRVGAIRGTVLTMTEAGDIYTRVGPREIRVYDVNGRLKGKVILTGLSLSIASIRFDPQGNIYQLDGIPAESASSSVDSQVDPEDRRYGPDMPGMRVIKWERKDR